MQNHIAFFISFISFMAFLAFFWTSIFSNSAFHLTNVQKSWFDNLEKEWQEPFKKLANFNDEEMKSVVDAISDMKKQRFNWLFESENTAFYHDERIPQNIMKKTHTVLKKYGINPYRIDIEFYDNRNAFAGVFDGPQVTNNALIPHFHYSSNPTIYISEALYNENDNVFENIILHECGHTAEAHSGQRALSKNILQQKNVDKTVLNTFFKRFTCIIELIADQRLTIGNEKNTNKMMAAYGGFLTEKSNVIKEKIANLLSNNAPLNCLKIDYDAGYPNHYTRFTALQMMCFALAKKQTPIVMS